MGFTEEQQRVASQKLADYLHARRIWRVVRRRRAAGRLEYRHTYAIPSKRARHLTRNSQ